MSAELLLYTSLTLIAPAATVTSLIAAEKIHDRIIKMSQMRKYRSFLASKTKMQHLRLER